MKARKTVSSTIRGLYIGIVTVFGLFLASSAPHRVHHFFERLPAAEYSAAAGHGHDHAEGAEHGGGDHQERPNSQSTDCLVFSVAQNSHASLVQPFAIFAVEHAIALQGDQAISESRSFNPSPFSQRAPPLA